MVALAHIDGAREEALLLHSLCVARRAEAFARAIRPGDVRFQGLVFYTALLHDLGKYRPEFQNYLRGRSPRSSETQHAVFGAAWALDQRLPRAIAFAINGHHAGLHDRSTLQDRILNSPDLNPIDVAKGLIPRLVDDLKRRGVTLPDHIDEFMFPDKSKDRAFQHRDELLIRMLFSCLVDADYLATESFMRRRERFFVPLEPLTRLEQVIAYVMAKAASSEGDAVLNRLRREFFAGCLSAAVGAPGFASLTAPTGGGKTLAGLAYALRHAAAHELKRVIIVLPFLSIIEQNARVYRDVLGDDVVVEHHSAVVRPEVDRPSDEPWLRSPAELAAENWNAPIIITTAVQFLESLFARKPSRCRKLHRVARSVVVLDECHTLPHKFLTPILDIARDLHRDFGTSFLFASATRPYFTFTKDHLPSG